MTVMRFGPGDLCRSVPASFILWFELGQPEFSFLLSLPIFKGFRRKIEQAIFSRA